LLNGIVAVQVSDTTKLNSIDAADKQNEKNTDIAIGILKQILFPGYLRFR